MLFLLLILHARSDDLEFVDYDKNTQYSWSDLQINNPYTIELDSVIIKFSVGENLKETCEGQYASAILFSKAGDSCHILGRHEDYFVYPFKIGKTRGIGIYYEGGGLCRDVLWGDVKRRTELKLLCSREESDFYLSNQLSDCTTILERRSKLGCPKEFEYSSWVKILFFT